MSKGEGFAAETAGGCAVLILFVVVFALIATFVNAVGGVLGVGVSGILKFVFAIIYGLGASVLLLLTAFGIALVIDATYPPRNMVRHWYETLRNAESCTYPSIEEFRLGYSTNGFQDLFIVMLQDAYFHRFKKKADENSFKGDTAAFYQFRRKYLIKFALSPMYKPIMEDTFAKIYNLFANKQIDPRFFEVTKLYLEHFEKDRHPVAITQILIHSLSFGKIGLPKQEAIKPYSINFLRGNQHVFYRFMKEHFFTILDKCPEVLDARRYPMFKAPVQDAKDTAAERIKLLTTKLDEKEKKKQARREKKAKAFIPKTSETSLNMETQARLLLEQAQSLLTVYLDSDTPVEFIRQAHTKIQSARAQFSDPKFDRQCEQLKKRLDGISQNLDYFERAFDYYRQLDEDDPQTPQWFRDAMPAGAAVAFARTPQTMGQKDREIKRNARKYYFREQKVT